MTPLRVTPLHCFNFFGNCFLNSSWHNFVILRQAVSAQSTGSFTSILQDGLHDYPTSITDFSKFNVPHFLSQNFWLEHRLQMLWQQQLQHVFSKDTTPTEEPSFSGICAIGHVDENLIF